jgi:hypothetical protein
MNNILLASITIFILLLVYVINLFFVDHFKPINSLQIKYNTDKVIKPNQLKVPNKSESQIKTEIAKLNKHPLQWNNQMYSMNKYPFVGQKQKCNRDSDCSQITAKCNIFDRNNGVGACTIRNPNETVFNIKF